MTDSGDFTPVSQPLGALERAQAVSRALSDAARRARFAARARGGGGGSFAARRGAKLIRIIIIALFVLQVAVPDLAVSIYFGLLASDQYVSEAKFTVSSAAIPKMDGVGSVTGLPPIIIIQDTQLVTNYIHSRPMVEHLEREVGLLDAYTSDSIDWWARFRKNKPIEKFTDYWTKMSGISIGFPSGIVAVTVRAFNPEDAKRIGDAVVKASENLINDLNERMWRDTVSASEADMKHAAELLVKTRVEMEAARNAEGIVDVGQTGIALNTLITGLEGELLKAQQDYQIQARYVTDTAPQIKALKARMASLTGQLDELKAQMTAQTEKSLGAAADKTLSGKMTKFSELELEHGIAQKRYATAVAALEAARLLSERKMLYLHQIVSPALPEEAQYPKRWLSVGVTFLASLIGWGATVGALVFVRNHMA